VSDTSDLLRGSAGAEERRLRRDLGFTGLTAIGFSNIVGSGWLFAALYAAQIAGPAALLSWLAAGVLCALVALVVVELGAAHPEGGGTARWPLYANGRLTGSLVGWSVLLSVGGTAAEISAILQYAGRYLPWLYEDDVLTWPGVAVAIAAGIVLTGLNWFAVRLFGRLNTLVTVVKIAVPVVTVVALLASGFHPGNITGHGGFAPYGYGASLSALAGGGIVYSVNGFQAPVDFSGEARNPRRTVPLAVLAGIGLAVLTYLLLQVAFLFAVPENLLGHGWAGVDFDSPFGQLALILNLHWLSALLYADAVVSPGGSALVGVAVNARHTYALAKSSTLPRWFMRVNEKVGVPRRALALNLVLIVVFLLPFSGWQQIVSVTGDMYLVTYVAAAVAAAVLRTRGGGQVAGWVPGLRWIAPVSFVVASEFLYWSGWKDLRIALPLVLIGLPLFLLMRGRRSGTALLPELRNGAWLVTYLAALLVISWLGTFKGLSVIPSPWDSALVAVLALGFFNWGVHSGRALEEPPQEVV